jgi:hypothetical protein
MQWRPQKLSEYRLVAAAFVAGLVIARLLLPVLLWGNIYYSTPWLAPLPLRPSTLTRFEGRLAPVRDGDVTSHTGNFAMFQAALFAARYKTIAVVGVDAGNAVAVASFLQPWARIYAFDFKVPESIKKLSNVVPVEGDLFKTFSVGPTSALTECPDYVHIDAGLRTTELHALGQLRKCSGTVVFSDEARNDLAHQCQTELVSMTDVPLDNVCFTFEMGDFVKKRPYCTCISKIQ